MDRCLKLGCVVNVGGHVAALRRILEALKRRLPTCSCVVLAVRNFNAWGPGEICVPGLSVLTVSPDVLGVSRSWQVWDDWRQMRAACRQFLAQHRFSSLLLFDDCEYVNWAMIHMGRSLGMTSVLVQEGPFYREDWILKPGYRRSWMNPLKDAFTNLRHYAQNRAPPRPAYGSGGADSIAASTERYRSLFIRAGHSRRRVHVSGVPGFDGLNALRCRQRCVPTNTLRRRVLVVSQPVLTYKLWNEQRTAAVYGDVADALRQDRSMDVVLRFHPSESEEERNLKRAVFATTRCSFDAMSDLHGLMADCDVCVGFYSTALLEARLAGRVVVAYAAPECATEAERFRSLGVCIVDNPADLLQACLHAPVGDVADFLPALEQVAGPLDGKASDRVAALCQTALMKSSYPP